MAVALPQANGQLKLRPALVLRVMPPFDDLLVCGISSQLRQAVAGFDEIISPEAADFAASGLRVQSVVRVGFLAVVPQTQVAGTMGAVGAARFREIRQRLSDFLRP